MLYSRWNPATGGYSYFETSEQLPIGADLPIPRLAAGPLGVASVTAGRPLPPSAREVGSGALARGLIVPTINRGVLGALAVNSRDLLVGIAGALAGFLFARWVRR